jgi:integrase
MMSRKKHSYQNGMVYRVRHKRSPDIWYFRAREYREDGSSRRPAVFLGDSRELSDELAARKKAMEKGLLQRFNDVVTVATMKELIDKFKLAEYPERKATIGSYNSKMAYIEERWGSEFVRDMPLMIMEIEVWLNNLKSKENPSEDLAKSTRSALHMVMSLLLAAAVRWKILPIGANPMDYVRVKKGAAPVERDTLITFSQFRQLMHDPELPQAVKVIVIIACLTGLRISEILGLMWSDIDFDESTTKVLRSFTSGEINNPKTANSKSNRIPISTFLRGALIKWNEESDHVEDWVFGSRLTGMPFTPNTIRKYYLKPAFARAGIKTDGTGFHTFRHSYRAWMADQDTAEEVQQELMRHGNLAQTIEYGKNSEKKVKKRREAQELLSFRATTKEG